MLTCTKCTLQKDPELFPPNKLKKNGKSSWCRMCNNKDTNDRAIRQRREIREAKDKPVMYADYLNKEKSKWLRKLKQS